MKTFDFTAVVTALALVEAIKQQNFKIPEHIIEQAARDVEQLKWTRGINGGELFINAR